MKYVSFHNSSFCLEILFNVNGKAVVSYTPCFKGIKVYAIIYLLFMVIL